MNNKIPENGNNTADGELRPEMKLWVHKGSGVFGPGIAELLIHVKKTGSVKSACEEMGVSYSKANKIIPFAEDKLGCKLVLRQQGGKPGESRSVLTETGIELIERYEAFVNECREMMQMAFDRHFEGFSLGRVGDEHD